MTSARFRRAEATNRGKVIDQTDRNPLARRQKVVGSNPKDTNRFFHNKSPLKSTSTIQFLLILYIINVRHVKCFDCIVYNCGRCTQNSSKSFYKSSWRSSIGSRQSEKVTNIERKERKKLLSHSRRRGRCPTMNVEQEKKFLALINELMFEMRERKYK